MPDFHMGVKFYRPYWAPFNWFIKLYLTIIQIIRIIHDFILRPFLQFGFTAIKLINIYVMYSLKGDKKIPTPQFIVIVSQDEKEVS